MGTPMVASTEHKDLLHREREREGGRMEEEGEKRTVCVTGAGGYVGSWLVKLLLSKDFIVHGTVRDPSDGKNAHLQKLEKAADNLQLFKADMLDYDDVASAIAGCGGVFHVASPVISTKVPDPEVQIIAPAVTGTLNVLKACSEVNVKRVVVVSSTAAIIMNPNWPQDKVKDEDCWSDKEHCRKIENWYFLSKTLAESEALEYAEKHGLDVVTVCPCMIIGPSLQSTVNASTLFVSNLLKEGRESLENKAWHLVDVRDVADALLLVYEKPEATGRYICAPYCIKTSDMVDTLKSIYPNHSYPKNFVEVEDDAGMSSEKLQMLGWTCRTLKESLMDSFECYVDAGLLNKDY